MLFAIGYRLNYEYNSVMSKTFTLDQVNELLPEVQRRLDLIIQKRSAYLRIHDAVFVQELAQDVEKKSGADFFDSDLEKDIQNLEETIYDLAQEIDSLIDLGCILRSLDAGLVDFPGQHTGERIFFAWKTGEKKINFIRRRGVSGPDLERKPL